MDFGWVDAGPQQGVCDKCQLDIMLTSLGATYGLKPVQRPTLEIGAMGVGGSTKFLSRLTLPVAAA
eukprot:8859891-Pyramimonas_sp.AAC.1